MGRIAAEGGSQNAEVRRIAPEGVSQNAESASDCIRRGIPKCGKCEGLHPKGFPKVWKVHRIAAEGVSQNADSAKD